MNPPLSPFLKWLNALPPGVAKWVSSGLSLAVGVAAAVMFHYLLYRIGLPSKPFIYVAF